MTTLAAQVSCLGATGGALQIVGGLGVLGAALVGQRQLGRTRLAAWPKGTPTWWAAFGLGTILSGTATFLADRGVWLQLVGVALLLVGITGSIVALVRHRRTNNTSEPESDPPSR